MLRGEIPHFPRFPYPALSPASGERRHRVPCSCSSVGPLSGHRDPPFSRLSGEGDGRGTSYTVRLDLTQPPFPLMVDSEVEEASSVDRTTLLSLVFT